jgi:ATP-dependent Lon protease
MQLSNYDNFPANLPVIIKSNTFIYPFMITPIFLSDKKNIESINYAIENSLLVFIATNKSSKEGSDDLKDCYSVGAIGSVMRKVSLPDGRIKVLFQGLEKGKISSTSNKQSPNIATIDIFKVASYDKQKILAMLDVLEKNIKDLSASSNQIPADLLKSIKDNDDPTRIVDLISSSISFSKKKTYEIYSQKDLSKRIMLLIDQIIKTSESIKIQKDIKSKVQNKIDKINKDYFLKEQMKQINKELGDESQKEELEKYYKKLKKISAHISKSGHKEIKRQIDRLTKMHPESSEASTTHNYIEHIFDIPFGKCAKQNIEIQNVLKKLNTDHYSLEKPKERIIEFFAVKEFLSKRKIKKSKSKGTILCFYGPPGTGKTSLANSIASAIKRKLVRIALGGLEDVNELRGHRRTYVGAMPGRIIKGLCESKEMNPVMVLDEIDKISRNFRGDPSAALLEILDPEQNIAFKDNYVNFSVNLSEVIFIATANDISQIPIALRDRMEFINISSYTPMEKYNIAKEYLIPQELKKHGLTSDELTISKIALEKIIENYTRESGVRGLRRQIAKIARKSVKNMLDNTSIKTTSITVKNIKTYLEKTVFEIEVVDNKNEIGVVNGLAWTQVGGDVLKIEIIKIRGKGDMKITGNLGDVMKESSVIAYSVVKTLIDDNFLNIDSKIVPKTQDEIKNKIEPSKKLIYKRFDLHMHVPEGATPKDGPSAGIAMATALASIYSNKGVKSNVAMTGELTLKGKVLPIGGLKEKLIAAHKAGIKIALIPKKNWEQDLSDIPKEIQNDMKIIAVSNIKEVIKVALI